MRRARGAAKPSNRLSVQVQRMGARSHERYPLMPHEHDESPETAPLADDVAVQAHADVTRGLVDTERRGDATQIFNRRRSSKGRRRR